MLTISQITLFPGLQIRVTSLEENGGGSSNTSILEERVDELEVEVGELGTSVTILESDVGEVDARVTTNEAIIEGYHHNTLFYYMCSKT